MHHCAAGGVGGQGQIVRESRPIEGATAVSLVTASEYIPRQPQFLSAMRASRLKTTQFDGMGGARETDVGSVCVLPGNAGWERQVELHVMVSELE